MTAKELAQKYSELLIQKPTDETIRYIARDIISYKVDGHPITRSEIDIILAYMDDEVGNLAAILESYDNSAALTLMARVRELIAKSKLQGQGGK